MKSEPPFEYRDGRRWRSPARSKIAPLLFLFLSPLVAGEFAHLAEAPEFDKGRWVALLNGKDLTGWTSRGGKAHTWSSAKSVQWAGAANPMQLSPQSGPGPIILNGANGRTADLLTAKTFGDLELYLEFMIPQKSNSGVYLQGLYEVQILDSFGVAAPGVHDCGAIYERWVNGKGLGGSSLKRNASRAPGEWQSFLIRFRAPRFDTSGKKLGNARFVRVVHNGVVVHENVEVDGPTRASLESPEAPEGPLMIQGDHGPVSLRNAGPRARGAELRAPSAVRPGRRAGIRQALHLHGHLEPDAGAGLHDANPRPARTIPCCSNGRRRRRARRPTTAGRRES